MGICYSESGIVSCIHTPVWARSKDAVAIVANGVDGVFNGLGGAGCEDYVLRLYSMNWFEVCVEEGG